MNCIHPSLACQALALSRAADQRKHPVRVASYLDRDRAVWVRAAEYLEQDGSRRVEQTEMPVAGDRRRHLNPQLVCSGCGRPPIPGQTTDRCLACNERLELTTQPVRRGAVR